MAEPLLDRTFLERLERLTLQWQHSFPGLVGGHNVSRYPGPGQEFLDHRHFHHGDDLRAINWRAYMRFEKLFLKMFQTEPRVPVRLLLDNSKSMAAISPEKFNYSCKLAASLCYVALVRLDSTTVHPFGSVLGPRFICSGGRHRFSPVMEYFSELQPSGRTNFLEVVRQFVSLYSQRGLLIVISDFLDDADCERALHFLADYGHELLLLQVWSEEDRVPPWIGELDLTDAETGAHVRIRVDEAARNQYTAAFDEYASRIRQLVLRHNGRYVGISTDTPVEDVLFGPLIRTRTVA
jgi:uncharacterized protein (DUF58 family)